MLKDVDQECFVLTVCPQKNVPPLLTTLTLNMSFISPPKPIRELHELHLYMMKICFIYLKTSLWHVLSFLKKISELHSTFQALVQKPQV